MEISEESKSTSAEIDLGGFGRFPNEILVIALSDGFYAANNATTPDGEFVNGLACFLCEEDASGYMAMPKGLTGNITEVSFEEARVIAKQKQKLNSLLLFRREKIIEIHWVK